MSAGDQYFKALGSLEDDAKDSMQDAIESIEEEDFREAAELLRSTADLVEQQSNEVQHLDELKKGQKVLFNDRVEPCTVKEEARGNGRDYWHVTLTGPRGGYLKLRQEGDILKGPNHRNLDDLRLV